MQDNWENIEKWVAHISRKIDQKYNQMSLILCKIRLIPHEVRLNIKNLEKEI